MEKLELVDSEEKTYAPGRPWGKIARRMRLLMHASVISGLAVLGCVVPGADNGDGDGGNPAGVGGFSLFGSGGNTGVGGDGIPGAGGGGVVGIGGGGIVGVGGGGVVGAGGGGIGTGGMGELPEGAEWITYDGNSGALTMNRTGTSTSASIHAVATAAHPNDSASVSLSISIAELQNQVVGTKGVKFNLSGSTNIWFQAQSTHVVPFAQGGNCDEGTPTDDLYCWNAHEKQLTVSPTTTSVTVLWDDLAQTYATETNPVVLYAADIILLSWYFPKGIAGEFHLDSIEFLVDDSPPASGVAALISKAQFNAIAGVAHEAYQYEHFIAATGRFAAFAGDADTDWAKREIAMFLANAKRETGSFTFLEEISPAQNYCNTAQYMCPAGADKYFGRGAMQLSWNYNYAEADKYLHADLLNHPEYVVAPDKRELLWDTALWFWMYGGFPSAPHAAFKQGLGATIQRINGIECGGGNPDAVTERVQHYKNALMNLEVSASGTDGGC